MPHMDYAKETETKPAKCLNINHKSKNMMHPAS